MKIKVSDATNNQLNWLVAKCEGVEAYMPIFSINRELMIKNPFGDPLKCPDYTTDFKFCDRIEQDNLILTNIDIEFYGPMYNNFTSTIPTKQSLPIGKGITPEISILRCYIVSKLGKETTIPDNIF